MSIKRFAVAVFLIALAVPPAGEAWALAGAWAQAGAVSARLVSAVDGAGRGAMLPLALEVRLAPGWKTYWREPGDAGLPPRVDWTGSRNLQTGVLAYPAPHRMTLSGIETVGYEGGVTFPIRAVPSEPGQPVAVRAAVDLLVCADLCVPERLTLALDVPAGPAAAGADAATVARAESQVPGDGRGAGLEIRRLAGDGGVLEVDAQARDPFQHPDVFIETDPPIAFRAPEVTLGDGGRAARLRLVALEPALEPPLAGRSMTVTLVDGARALEGQVVVQAAALAPLASPAQDLPAPGLPAPGLPAPGLPAMLAVAVLGGLILNLMPCVLPVLSLKILYLAQHAGAAARAVRAGFLASAAGILASFLAMALAMVGFKAGGAAIGWGVQFQEPVFLVFMLALVTLFAANLWGVFEIVLPRALADRLAGPEEGHGLAGPFLTGAFATLLATPCSAPFLGTAVGFALTAGTWEILAIFTALGLGMGLPYLLVAAFPGVAGVLPRPGRWMVVLRRVMGGALAVTGVWLAGVLAAQVGPGTAVAVAAAMVAMVPALWLGRRLAAGWVGPGLAAALAVVAFALPSAFGRSVDARPVAEMASGWVAFDESAIPELVAQGRTVFVDVTAQWCVTCQANKKLVINRGEVARRLGMTGVVAMKADWTSPDANITRFLAGHGRYGIPFNIVYGPNAPGGVPLPELLSEGAVLEALDAAGPRR